ncbi:Myb-like DNA-binding domain containing protein [Tritrichomonas foetus]|uniref:Myb-like DNA-binding domain containing protein n=1 Tax=Tritrichomonas foetus TaxID=1144522 RepID=A0A1J4KRA4_9EUKA|nr:Myb-like DNA-binding domain containing protein [Tritrichomonas foetus]|eukprot:OHT13799.1 Myb-like DNA-binding domain containing protein [Tritrichomonas foetus]
MIALSHQADPMRKKRKERSKFTQNEDQKLMKLVQKYGDNNWVLIAGKFNGRTPRQCRDRYVYYLDPNIKKGDWTRDEENILLEKYQQLGSSWKLISNFLPGRTEIDLKNRFLKIDRAIKKTERKKLREMEKMKLSHFSKKKKKNMEIPQPKTLKNENTNLNNINNSINSFEKIDHNDKQNEVIIDHFISNDDFFFHEEPFQADDPMNWFFF